MVNLCLFFPTQGGACLSIHLGGLRGQFEGPCRSQRGLNLPQSDVSFKHNFKPMQSNMSSRVTVNIYIYIEEMADIILLLAAGDVRLGRIATSLVRKTPRVRRTWR